MKYSCSIHLSSTFVIPKPPPITPPPPVSVDTIICTLSRVFARSSTDEVAGEHEEYCRRLSLPCWHSSLVLGYMQHDMENGLNGLTIPYIQIAVAHTCQGLGFRCLGLGCCCQGLGCHCSAVINQSEFSKDIADCIEGKRGKRLLQLFWRTVQRINTATTSHIELRPQEASHPACLKLALIPLCKS